VEIPAMQEAARKLEENGTVPHSTEHPEVYRQRSGGVILPEDADWIESTRELRSAIASAPDAVQPYRPGVAEIVELREVACPATLGL
jgi:hypothetical protein